MREDLSTETPPALHQRLLIQKDGSWRCGKNNNYVIFSKYRFRTGTTIFGGVLLVSTTPPEGI